MITIKKYSLLALLLLSTIFINSEVFADAVTLNVVADSASCFDSKNGQVTITITSGTGNYSYYISKKNYWPFPGFDLIDSEVNTPAASHTFTVDTGFYYILIMDTHGDIGQATRNVYEPQLLQANPITVAMGPTCSFSSDAQLEANPIGGTPPYTYQWSAAAGSQTTKIATGIGPGAIYRVTVNDKYNCDTSLSGGENREALPFFTHDSIPLPLNGGSIANSQSICYNTSPAIINSVINASGERGFTYQWQDSVSGGSWNNIAGTDVASYNPPGNLTQTTYYRRIATALYGCGSEISNIHTVNVYLDLDPGTIGADQNICYNTIPAAFSNLSAASGGGGITYQWQYREGAGAWTDIAGANSITYAETAALTVDREYRRAAISTKGCGTDYSNTITVSVYPDIDPGVIADNQTICYNTSPAAFTSTTAASGGGGTTYQWQYREGAGAWTDIAGATAVTYNEPGNLTVTREYRRAAISSQGCGTRYSNTVTVTVYPDIDPGVIAADQNICFNTIPAAFTSTTAATGGGTLNYQWQYREGAGAWTDIVGATSATYAEPAALTVDREYRRAAISANGCGTDYSNVITVSVYPDLTPGTIATDQTICYNTSPAAFTSTTPASGGGAFTYQWQYREGAGAWTNIPGTNSATYTESATLTTDREYRRAANSTQGCGTVYSNIITISVYPDVDAGTIAADQSICFNTSPAAFTSTIAASGGGGTTYQWQYREGAGVWTDIAGATAATYNEPGNLTIDREYRRAAISTQGCGTDYSNIITVTVYPAINPGTIGSDQSICYNTTPAAFTNVAAASGGGTLTYQWQYREGAGAWTDIAGATSLTFTESVTLTVDREYRRAAISGSGCGTQYSNVITVTVYAQLNPGVIASNQNICYNTSPAAFTSTTAASGGGGTSYQWQYRVGAGAWTNIAGATAATYTESATLTADREYRRAATSTQGCGTVYSNVITVSVYPDIDPGTIAANQNICFNTSPAAFTSTNAASGGGGTTYQWQYREGAGAWTDIPGAIAATYNEPANLTVNREYRRAAISTQGCGTDYSNVITITVYAAINPGSIAADQSICYNTTPAAFTNLAAATGGGSLTYQWQYREGVGPWTDIPGANAVTYTEPANLITDREYRRAAISSSGCGTDYSNVVSVTVYPDIDPGIIAADQSICYNSTPAAFTSVSPATGGGGTTYQWQYREGAGAWTNIAGATAATYAESANLTTDREYRRAAISTQGCGTQYSNVINVTVYANLNPGTIASDQSICFNTSPAAFTSTTAATGGGGFTYQWQYREGAGAWTDIAGATAASYTEPANLITNREYRRAAISTQGCGTQYSNVINVTVYSAIAPGTIAADQSICYNTSPAAFTSVTGATGGGTLTYQWQYREGAGAWTDIAGATAATYNESANLVTDREYRRAAISTQGCGTDYSNTVTVTVYPQLDPGTVASDQSICFNTIPAAFTNVAAASGGGGFTYQWQYREGAGAWTDIAGATAVTFAETLTLTVDRQYRRAAISTQGCGTQYSNIITVTVYPAINPGTIAADQNICYNTTPAAFASTAAASGGGTLTYQWQYREGAGAWTDIAGATSATYAETANLTVDREYRRAAISTNGCGTEYSNVITVSVYAQFDAGSITADQSICYNSTPAAFTSTAPATGGGGFTYQWQYREGAGAWTDIAGATTATYSETTNLTVDREYRRAAISTQGCGTDYSNTVTVTVYNDLDPGVIAADQSICFNTIPASFTSTTPATGGGGFTYQWQYREGAGVWTDIAGATAATYSEIANLTVDREYRRAAISTQGCGTEYSNVITITVYPDIDPGTIAADQDICYNTVPAPFTSTTAASGGGTLTYQWQYRVGAGAWTDIAGATSATYAETANLTTDRDYRRAAISSDGCGTRYSNIISIIVYAQLDPGAVAADQTICYNTTPAAFTSTTPAVGGGGFTYQWQYREGAGAWTDIAGATADTFTEPGTLTIDREYRRAAISTQGCGTVYSNTITVSVYPDVDPGVIASDQSICFNSIPAPFTSTTPGSGGGGVSYIWQYREGAGAWTDIAGSNSETYAEPSSLITDREYRRGSISSQGCGTQYSNVITVTVYPDIAPGVIAADQTICYNTVPAAFSSTTDASGGGTLTYQWQYREGAGAWTDIAGATSASFTETANLTIDRDYRRAAISADGCGTQYSNVVTVSVYAQLDPGTVAADQTVCYNSVPDPFGSLVPASGGGGFTYQWQYRDGSGAWTDIAGATNMNYSETAALTVNREYRRAAISTQGCGTTHSNVLTITITPRPTAEAGPNDTICNTALNFQPLFANATNYSTITWNILNGSGSFQGGINNVLDPIYVISDDDRANGAGSVVQLELIVRGTGGCGTVNARDTLEVLIGSELEVSIGEPAPFIIRAETDIEVCISTSGHLFTADMGFHLQSPDRSIVTLKRALLDYDPDTPPCFPGPPGDVDSLCFTTDLTMSDSLHICSEALPISGDFGSANNWDTFYGKNPAEGGWTLLITDTDDFGTGGTDGDVVSANIVFTDTATATGELTTVRYFANSLSEGINDNDTTRISIPRRLQVSCSDACDAQAIVNVTGGVAPYTNYNWSPLPAGGNGRDTVLLCAGTYNLTVTDAFGCIGTTTVEVVSPPAIVFDSFTFTDSLSCAGDSTGVVNAKASGGTGSLTYSLLPMDIISSHSPDSGYFDTLTAGTYTLRVEDINGCSIDTIFTIHEPLELALDTAYISDSVFCDGDTNGRIVAAASGGTQPYTFILEPLSLVNDSGIFDNLPPGNYYVRVTDANDCDTIDSGTLIIGAPVPLAVDTVIVDSIVCNGGEAQFTVEVTGGYGPYDVYVDGVLEVSGVTDVATISRTAGDYDISVEDQKGCTATWPTLSITDPPVITVDAVLVTDVDSCYNSPEGEIAVTLSGGVPPFTYSRDSVEFNATGIFTDLLPGTYTIYYGDSRGCIDSLSATVNGPEAITATFDIVHVQGNSLGSIQVNATGGTPYNAGEPYRYSIDGVPTPPGTESFFDSLEVGVYTIRVEDSLGCIFETPVAVIELQIEMTITITEPDCYGGADGEIAFDSEDIVFPYSIYNLAAEDTIIDLNVTYLPYFYTTRADTFELLVIDATGRTYDSTFVIEEPEPLDINADIEYPTCAEFELDGSRSTDGSISVTTSGGVGDYAYSWNFTTSVDSVQQGLGTGTYVVSVTDANGCIDSSEYDLIGEQIINARISMIPADESNPGGPYFRNDTTVCYLSPFRLEVYHGGSNADYLWEPDSLFDISSDITSSSVYMTVRHESFLTTTVSTETCFDTDELFIRVFDTLGIAITAENGVHRIYDTIYVPFNDPVSLDATSGFVNYLWLSNAGMIDNPTDSSIIFTPLAQEDLGDALDGTPFEGLLDDYLPFVMVRGENAGGCPEYDTLYTMIQTPILDVPTVFTPNNDGYNDYWRFDGAISRPLLEVLIFNRWGQQIFYSSPYGTDESHMWDGKNQKTGKDLPVGTYYYVINPNDGESEPITGTVTIVR